MSLGPVSLILPFPVPLHACFIQGKHRGGGGFPTKRYKEYRAAAWAAWAEQGMPRVRGPVAIDVALVAPNRQPRDAGNLDKCLLDNLVHLKVIEDDNNRIVQAILWRWEQSGPPCLVTVHPWRGPGQLSLPGVA